MKYFETNNQWMIKKWKKVENNSKGKKSLVMRWIMTNWMKWQHSVYDLIEMTKNNEITNDNCFQEKVNEICHHLNDLSIHQFNHIFES